MQSQEKEAEAQKDLEELKKVQEELRAKSAIEIIELKKEQYQLIVEKAHLWDSRVRMEEAQMPVSMCVRALQN